MPKNNNGNKAPKGAKQSKARKDSPGFQQWKNVGAGPSARGVRVGFPANRTVELRYTERVLLGSTTGLLASYQYRLNSAFDPNFTGAGHQPSGFDQWASFYNHYAVESCRYQVDVASENGFPYMFGTYLSDDSVTPTTASSLTESGGVTALKNAQNNMHLFEGSVKMSEFFNRGDVATDSALRADVGANPTDAAFLTVWAQPADQTSTAEAYALVTLIMRARFMEPKDLPPSLDRTPVKATLHPTLETEERPSYRPPPGWLLVKPECDHSKTDAS